MSTKKSYFSTSDQQSLKRISFTSTEICKTKTDTNCPPLYYGILLELRCVTVGHDHNTECSVTLFQRRQYIRLLKVFNSLEQFYFTTCFQLLNVRFSHSLSARFTQKILNNFVFIATVLTQYCINTSFTRNDIRNEDNEN